MGNKQGTKRKLQNDKEAKPIKKKRSKRKTLYQEADIAHPYHLHSGVPYPEDDASENANKPITVKTTNQKKAGHEITNQSKVSPKSTNSIKVGQFVGDTASQSTGGSIVGAVVPFGPANIKVYRSYSQSKADDISSPEIVAAEGIRVYRKRSDNLTKTNDRRSDPGLMSNDYPELRSKNDATLKLKRLEMMETKEEDAMSSCDSDFSPDGKVNRNDFPCLAKREERLGTFRSSYNKLLTEHLTNLRLPLLLQRIIVAHQHGRRQYSIRDFIESHHDLPKLKVIVPDEVADELMRRRVEFRMRRRQDGRVDGEDDKAGLHSMVEKIIKSSVSEAADQLCRIYENQIVLVADDESIVMLAKHASLCSFEFATLEDHNFNANAFIEGVVCHQLAAYKPRFLQTKLGRCIFIWELDSIFKKPGLRFDNPLLWTWAAQLKSGQDVASLLRDRKISFGYRENAWSFYMDDNNEASTYGYRSVILEHVGGDMYRFGNREKYFLKNCNNIKKKPDDYHKLFVPTTCLLNKEIQYLDLKAFELLLKWSQNLPSYCKVLQVSIDEDQQGLMNDGKHFCVGKEPENKNCEKKELFQQIPYFKYNFPRDNHLTNNNQIYKELIEDDLTNECISTEFDVANLNNSNYYNVINGDVNKELNILNAANILRGTCKRDEINNFNSIIRKNMTENYNFNNVSSTEKPDINNYLRKTKAATIPLNSATLQNFYSDKTLVQKKEMPKRPVSFDDQIHMKRLNEFPTELTRKETIVQYLQELRVIPLKSSIPENKKALDRQNEIRNICEKLGEPQTILNLYGPFGIGKSTVAINAANALSEKMVCVYVDCHGCFNTNSVMRRCVRHFGLKFFSDHLQWFINFLKFHSNQQILFILDNIPPKKNGHLSDLLENFVDLVAQQVQTVRFLCITVEPMAGCINLVELEIGCSSMWHCLDDCYLWGEMSGSDVYRMITIFKDNPYVLYLVSRLISEKFLNLDGLKTILQSLDTNIFEHQKMRTSICNVYGYMMTDGRYIVISFIHEILRLIDADSRQILVGVSAFRSGFDVEEVAALTLTGVEETMLDLDRLMRLALVEKFGKMYRLPEAVRLATSLESSNENVLFFKEVTIGKLLRASQAGVLIDKSFGMEIIEKQYDNIIHAINIQNESFILTSDQIEDLVSLPSVTYLKEQLPRETLRSLYLTTLWSSRTLDQSICISNSLCALACNQLEANDILSAASQVSEAFRVLASVGNYYCILDGNKNPSNDYENIKTKSKVKTENVGNDKILEASSKFESISNGKDLTLKRPKKKKVPTATLR